MKFLKSGLAAALVLGPSIAFAAAPGYLDGYYLAKEKLKVDGGGSDHGEGFGLRAMAPVGAGVLVEGEYQFGTLNDSDIEIDQTRLGVGYMTSGPLRFGGIAEYAYLQIDAGSNGKTKPDGYGLHGRVEYSPMSAATLYGQVGYVRLSDHGTIDGAEWLVGAAYNFTPTFGAFADYRATDLKDSDNVNVKLQDIRLGLRLNFGAL